MQIEESIQEKLNTNLANLVPTIFLITGLFYSLIPLLIIFFGGKVDSHLALLNGVNFLTSLLFLGIYGWIRKNPLKPSHAHPLVSFCFLLVLVNILLRGYWENELLGVVFYPIAAAILLSSIRWFILVEGVCVAASVLIAFFLVDSPAVKSNFLIYPFIGAVNGILIFSVRFLSALRSEGANLDLKRRTLELEQSNAKLAMLLEEKEMLADSLVENEKRSRQILNISPVSILVHKDGNILWANPEMIKMLGFDPDSDLSKSTIFDFMEETAANKLKEEFITKSGQDYVMRPKIYSISRLNGEKIQVEITSLPFEFEGKAARVIFVKDVTLQLDYENTLMKVRDEALSANLEKSRFLSSMSHELRTPMNAILGFAQLLELDKETLSEYQNEAVQDILAGGRHLLSLINEVLDLSQIESGKMSCDIEKVSLKQTIAQCSQIINTLAKKSNIQIDYGNPQDYIIMADPQRLKQVLLNYLSNGIKYNRPNGHITINYQTVEENRLRVNVTDTGAGISDDDISRLFKPFSKVGDVSANIEGTGIGLAISKELMTLMGGTVGVSSIVGEGSTFWLEIKLS